MTREREERDEGRAWRRREWADEEGSVYRLTPLPKGELRGRFLVADAVVDATREALVSFALEGLDDAGHEGIVYWCGREMIGGDGGNCTVFLQAIVPVAEHGPGRVMVSREEMGRAQRAAHARKMGLLCQVHSHPRTDTRHSDGDDTLVFMPFEGMLSIVAPRYGLGLKTIADVSVHQFQDGRWVLCSKDSVARGLVVVPAMEDLRDLRE